jgi:hypothetical protein
LTYFFISLQGNTQPSGPCEAGYYCTLGAYNATPSDGSTGDICPVGKYCVQGSITGTGCPVGTFNNVTGLKADNECTDCTGGFYCGSVGLTSESGTCWAGMSFIFTSSQYYQVLFKQLICYI